jgi:hypothetical protein
MAAAIDNLDPLDYLDHLARESARFAAALRDTSPEAAVPTCPDWTADDLLWHLAEVQWFWGTIVREKVTETTHANALDAPSRPDDHAGLLAFYEQASRDLGATLAATPPDTTAWTWADEQTAGFIRRRQAPRGADPPHRCRGDRRGAHRHGHSAEPRRGR